MRRASKRDRNEGPIRARAEALGFLWLENNASTKGRPDACLLRNGQTYWCEVKELGASYTPAQVDEFPRLIAKGVPVYVLEAPEDVDNMALGMLRPWSPLDAVVVRDAKGRQKTKREHRPGYDRARSIQAQCCIAHCITSRLPGEYLCAKHNGGQPPRETANVENGLLPAPHKGVSGRKGRVAR